MSFITQPVAAPSIFKIKGSSPNGAGGNTDFYVSEYDILFYSGVASAQTVLNVTNATASTLNDAMFTGDVLNIAYQIRNGAAGRGLNGITIDGTGSGVSVLVASGAGFVSSSPSAIVSFDLSITKVNTAAWEVLANQTTFPGNFVSQLPNVPTAISATDIGNGSGALVYFSPGASGLLPTLSYEALSNPSGIVASGTTSPITVQGLTSGAAYTFTVRAENAAGFSVQSSASNSVTITASYSGDILVVAGGGGGGKNRAAGGGGGGTIITGVTLQAGQTYTVAVGGGGPAGATNIGTNGNPSQFGTTSTLGGGGGGGQNGAQDGASGGSGGGGPSGKVGGAGTTGQGNAGGAGSSANRAGGGGGKNAVGANSSGSGPGAGGAGVTNDYSGSSQVYGSGGGGGSENSEAGGAGGTNAGSGGTNSVDATTATDGFGGGGGGGGNAARQDGTAGGRGVVILRYPDTRPAATATTGSPIIDVSGGYRRYIWSGAGSITI